MGVANPLPVSLKYVNFYRLLSRSFPQILVADDVWLTYLKNSSQSGVYDSGDGHSPALGFIDQYSLHKCAEDPDFSAGAEE